MSGGERRGTSADDYLAYSLARASTLVSRQFHARVSRAGLRRPSGGCWRRSTIGDHPDHRRTGGDHPAQAAHAHPGHRPASRSRAGCSDGGDEPEDRRITRVSISAAGREKVRPRLERAKAHEAQVLLGYPPEEVETLKAGLREMIARLSEQQ
ncbi:MAG: MarR family winged helix-turn-helix transcriptional regulator [Arhodomonas sp.]|nr:MarR family winged helix-turn-helix transcriptional regulator [Arhodomonas sp.]